MGRFLYILSVVITTVGFAGLHVYLWVAVGRRTQLPRVARVMLMSTIIAVGLCASGIWALTRFMPHYVFGWLSPATFTWLVLLLFMLSVFGAIDGVRIVRHLIRRRAGGAARSSAAADSVSDSEPPAQPVVDTEPTGEPEPVLEPARRQFLARAAASAAVATAGGLAAVGLHEAFGDFEVPEVEVKLERLPRALDGYRVAVLADLHIGPYLDGRFVRRVVEQANRIRPDLVAIVGDLVDGPVHAIGKDIAQLGGLEARHGAYFVTGNHEYYGGPGSAEEWMGVLPGMGVDVLSNRVVSVGDRGPGGASFDLAGVPDRRGRWFGPAHSPRLSEAVAGRDPERELIVLAHQPVLVSQSAEVGAGLQLSGHTHGGQVLPFGLVTRMSQPYLAGLHRHGSGTQVYVSRGLGFWGAPMRLFAPPELTLVVLRSA